MSQYLQEAFKQFKLLEGEEFDIDDSGIEDMKSFIDNDEATDFTDIIDPEAETEEDLEDSYIGKIILDCQVCHSKIYKNAEDVDYNEETGIANEGEECPYCYSVDGFAIVGQVAPYQETEVDVDVEPKEGEEDSIEVKSTGEKGMEAAGAAMDAFWDEPKDESLKESKKSCKDCEDDKECDESLNEDIQDLKIETEHDVIHVDAHEKEDTEAEEVIAPIEPAQETTILDNEPPAEEDEEEAEFDFDDFDEESFDTMGESYLKKVYENVNSFKTNKVRVNGNQLIVEGIIKFKSGKDKKTSFKFEAKDCDRKGNVRFIGENLQISRGKKSFSLRGSINENKLTPNQLKYNYTVNGNKVSGKVIAEAKKTKSLNEAWSGIYSPTFLSKNLNIDKEEAKKFSVYLWDNQADDGYRNMQDIVDDYARIYHGKSALEYWYDKFKSNKNESLTEAELSKVAGTASNAMSQKGVMDKLGKCSTAQEVKALANEVIPENRKNDAKVKKLMLNLDRAKDVVRAQTAFTNFILKGDGLGSIEKQVAGKKEDK